MIIQNGIVFSEKLLKFDYLQVHGMSMRFYGNQSFLNGHYEEKETKENRVNFLNLLDVNLIDVVNPALIHGSNILDVKRADRGKGAFVKRNMIKEIDGLITKYPETYLMVTVADCLPIFFFEPNEKVVGLIHAGWKGTYERITEKMVVKMTREYTCNPKNIIIFIGPSIGPCHYEVKEDVASKFDERSLVKRNEKTYLDLWKANKDQLLVNGVREKNIELAGECTACHLDRYSSYRMEGENWYIAMAAVIGIK